MLYFLQVTHFAHLSYSPLFEVSVHYLMIINLDQIFENWHWRCYIRSQTGQL